MFINQLCDALDHYKIPYAIVGGHALALHGAVRGTVDIDFVLRWNKKNLIAAEQALASIGLESRLPLSAEDIFNFRDEYINNKNLIAWSFYNPARQDEQVDLLINFDLGKKSTLTANTESGKIKYLTIPKFRVALIFAQKKCAKIKPTRTLSVVRYCNYFYFIN